MIRRLLLLLLLFNFALGFAFLGFSSVFAIDIISCSSEYDVNVSNSEYFVTQNLSVSGTGNCLAIDSDVDNITLDCQGYALTGGATGGNGIYGGNLVNNITVKNCIIDNFYYGVQVGSGVVYDNITVLDSYDIGIVVSQNNGVVKNSIVRDSRGLGLAKYGIHIWGAHYNSLINITIFNNSNYGIYLLNSNYNYLKNITAINNSNSNIVIQGSSENILEDIYTSGTNFPIAFLGGAQASNNNTVRNAEVVDSKYGVYLDDANYNLFDDIYLTGNNVSEIYFSNFNYNNTFQNSYLGNFTMINSSNWGISPTFFYDNTYLAGTVPVPACFDVGETVCESVAPIFHNDGSSSNVFPFESNIGVLISLVLCVLFFMN